MNAHEAIQTINTAIKRVGDRQDDILDFTKMTSREYDALVATLTDLIENRDLYNEGFEDGVESMNDDIGKLRDEIKDLEVEIKDLEEEIKYLKALNEELESNNSDLCAENEELKRLL